MRIAPISVKEARRRVKEWHRHLEDLQGGLFAVQVVGDDGACLGVAVAGNPARVWQGTGRIVISRVATTGARNACSMLYGALCRAAKALGYSEAWTYTLPEEPGASLRAAGFVHAGFTEGRSHDRPSRRRNPPVRGDRKQRWVRKLS
jgi:hypothetical protein